MKITAESFLKDVESHELNILRDDGVYRHIFVKQPNTVCESFNIITTPGYLIYYGDMGSFVFTRVQDMFNFFRRKELSINEGYWAEKLEAADRHGGYEKFSFEQFKENLMSYCETDEQKQWMESELEFVGDDEHSAIEFCHDFDNNNEAGVDLSDFWECDNNKYTHRFIWCCYALVWTIQQYDLLNTESKAA